MYPSAPSDAELRASSECLLASGTDCDSSSLLSQSAASCIAELEGMPEGLQPWSAGLYYNSEYGRFVWSVSTTTEQRADGRSAGSALSIDATTGFVLDASAWQGIPGRPFLVDHRPRTAESVPLSDYSAALGVRLDGIPAELRAALAAAWTRVGLLEHASVAAFARFALQLLGLGAPPELLEGCQQAMRDELRHTRLAFGLASAYAEAPIGPGQLKLDGALDSPSEDLLAHVAMNTLVEGCIGETIASLDAREGAARATDPHVRQVLGEIAADEERHAQLAWRFLDWALAQRPSLASLFVARARAQLSRKPAWTPSLDVPGPEVARRASSGAALLQHGMLPPEQKLELEAQALEQVILPCLRALATKHELTSRSDALRT